MSIASENREGGNRAVDLALVSLPIDALTPYEGNAKKHEEPDIRAIAESIKAFGFSDPIGIWGPDNLIVEGHGRLLAAKECGLDTVPCIRLDHLSADERRAYALAHNKTAELSGWDLDALDVELDALEESFDMEAFGFDAEGGGFPDTPDFGGVESAADFRSRDEAKGRMKDKYLVPPFSIIYGNKPDWLARKRAWLAKGIRSELGRGGNSPTIREAIRRQTSKQGGG